MLFNSPEFIFVFLPLVYALYYLLLGLKIKDLSTLFLVAASFFFYAWWKPVYLILITFSIIINYSIGYFLTKNKKKSVLIIGIMFNLVLLGYFKYANFVVLNIEGIFNTQYHFDKIVLPLAISFFTFQQISYLADAYKGLAKEYDFLSYCLFVSFFPQLIAGPIVHHKEMMPQFKKGDAQASRSRNFSIGITIFCIGLFKKAVIADSVAPWADSTFNAVAAGQTVQTLDAWVGTLAYTFQLYFDFSGYSDMAIGLGRMFGIILPINFNSPYKATNIIQFWHRWHISLSTFLRDYLYIPLGGNKKGKYKRYENLFITMLLGGLWHGAGWTFVLWGALHGAYLIINNIWIAIRTQYKLFEKNTFIYTFICQVITLVAVMAGWVVFRASSVTDALSIWKSLIGLNGTDLNNNYYYYLGPLGPFLSSLGVTFVGSHLTFSGIRMILALGMLLFISWTFPNTQQIMHRFKPGLDINNHSLKPYFLNKIAWTPSIINACILFLLFAAYLLFSSKISPFLYFQF